MFPSKKMMLAFAAAAFLAGCGGGSSAPAAPAPSPSPATPAAAKGSMIDGYVRGATVFCDANGNGELDAGEVSTTTNATGGYSLTGGCDATVVGIGGFNIVSIDTEFPFKGKLATPKGSTVITPLTTMVATSPLTKEQFAESLSLPPGTDITQIDIANGQNQGLLKTTLAVHQIIDGIVRIVASKGGGNVQAIYGRVAQGFGNTLAKKPKGTVLISPSGDFNSSLTSDLVKLLPDVQALGISAADFDAAINALIADAQMFAKASDKDLLNLTKDLQSPDKAPINTSATSSYLNLVDESVSFNGAKVSLAELQTGATISGLTTLGFNLKVTGTPAADVTTSLALELVEQGGSGRKLQLLIEQVQLKLNQANQLSVEVPLGAKVYAYGRAGNGTEINLVLADLSFKPITVTDNGFSLNYSNMVNKVLASAADTTKTTAEKFVNIKGTFNVKVVMAKVNLRHSDSTAFTNQVITVTNTNPLQSVTGAGFSGTLIVN